VAKPNLYYGQIEHRLHLNATYVIAELNLC
jgi:hypothetical protein